MSVSAQPWGKLSHDAAGKVVREQSLRDHSRDVAAVFESLLRLPGIARRVARLAGTADLDSRTCERLAYLVHLHDCGKVNAGFQARRDRAAPMVGHIAPLAALFGDNFDPSIGEAALAALHGDRIESWGVEAAGHLLDAIFSHHGRPWQRDGDGRKYVKHWRAKRDYDPLVALAVLREDADRCYPRAIEVGGHSFPVTNEFVHAIAGLTQLADWIASSDWERAPNDATRATWAQGRLREIGLDPEPWRNLMRSNGLPAFEHLFGRDAYPHQLATGASRGQVVLLEAETGSGKTEAALWLFASLFECGAVDGLYFALPTRTSAAELHRRTKEFVAKLWPDSTPPVVLAVPGYLDDDSAGALPSAFDEMDGPEHDTRRAPVWAAEHPKRFFAATISVGTIDQALLSALRVKHAHLRGAALMRHLLVVDEVHASDTYMQGILTQLLHDHVAAGGYALLLSATLGAEARSRLLVETAGGRTVDVSAPTLSAAVETPYPLLTSGAPLPSTTVIPPTGASKRVEMRLEQWLDDPVAIARAAHDAAVKGAKVLIVRNTVDGAVAVQRAVESLAGDEKSVLFNVEGQQTLHHGRFAREDRRLLDDAVTKVIGRTRPDGGLVLVGTQTLEQSLDIDADLLITDLCPADVLLQRLGRLHRHVANEDGTGRRRPESCIKPRTIVLEPAGGLGPFLLPRRPGGLKRHGLGYLVRDGIPLGVYRDLAVLEATRQQVRDHDCWILPAMNRQIVESALHSEAIEELLASFPSGDREAWDEHRRRLVGDNLSQALVARESVLMRERPFMEQGLSEGEHIFTRLGADDRIFDLPGGTVGPFGKRIQRLSIPGWLIHGVPADTVPDVQPSLHSIGICIQLGDVILVYDRHGLRKPEEA